VHDGEVAIAGAHTIVHVDKNGRPAPIGEHERVLLTS
jgi:hypothetical protein